MTQRNLATSLNRARAGVPARQRLSPSFSGAYNPTTSSLSGNEVRSAHQMKQGAKMAIRSPMNDQRIQLLKFTPDRTDFQLRAKTRSRHCSSARVPQAPEARFGHRCIPERSRNAHCQAVNKRAQQSRDLWLGRARPTTVGTFHLTLIRATRAGWRVFCLLFPAVLPFGRCRRMTSTPS